MITSRASLSARVRAYNKNPYQAKLLKLYLDITRHIFTGLSAEANVYSFANGSDFFPAIYLPSSAHYLTFDLRLPELTVDGFKKLLGKQYFREIAGEFSEDFKTKISCFKANIFSESFMNELWPQFKLKSTDLIYLKFTNHWLLQYGKRNGFSFAQGTISKHHLKNWYKNLDNTLPAGIKIVVFEHHHENKEDRVSEIFLGTGKYKNITAQEFASSERLLKQIKKMRNKYAYLDAKPLHISLGGELVILQKKEQPI